VISAKSDVDAFREDIRHAIDIGCHIFFIKCRSSGRLLILLERIMRQHHHTLRTHFSFAGTGADSTLPHSITDFEDNMMYGVRQLLQAGWKPGDLLVTVNAGGTTRFLLEILKCAYENGDRRPTMVFGNPIDQLVARCSSHPIFVD
jgi:N-acetylmuramic acid 6-phosphate (MurNAc-6-P) etherase